jgi:two-component system, cell cycle response regulator CtrA
MRVLVLSPNAPSDHLLVGLRSEGLVCDTASDLDDLPSALALSGPYDVVVLDLVSLDSAAHRAVRALRRSGSAHPVLAVCARLEPNQEKAALHAGVDDVVQHPLNLPVLHARIQALVRRARGYASARLVCGNVTLDQELHAVLVDGRRAPLTGREYDFLQVMMLHKGVLLTKERFMSGLYADVEEAPDLKIVDVFVCKLRRKLAACGAAEMIRTVWGRGHVLFDPSPAAVAAARAAHRPEAAPEPAPRGWQRRAEATRLSARPGRLSRRRRAGRLARPLL